jgi:hypothetical protein
LILLLIKVLLTLNFGILLSLDLLVLLPALLLIDVDLAGKTLLAVPLQLFQLAKSVGGLEHFPTAMVRIGDLLHGLGHRACPGLNLVVFASDSHLDVVMLAHRGHDCWHQGVLALILVAAVRAQRLHVRLGIVILSHSLIHVTLFDIGT